MPTLLSNLKLDLFALYRYTEKAFLGFGNLCALAFKGAKQRVKNRMATAVDLGQWRRCIPMRH
ncbi:hypothetical protein ABIF52_000447 [Bradyrhizobium japonicum]